MTVKLEADGVHFYCSSPEVTRKPWSSRIIGPSRTEDRRHAVRLSKAEDRLRPADPQVPRT